MKRWILALPFLLPGLVQAEESGVQGVTTATLENGLDVVVIEDHRAPVAVQMLWYRTGSADEPPGVSGVAHLLEHLMFKSTDTLEEGEFSEVVAANGGSDNAQTSHDYTVYFQRFAADRLGLMMQMEADRMNNLRLSEADVETEREVVLEERNQRTESNPYALAREQFNAAQYLNHRYGLPVIGWMHEMEALDYEDIVAFYQKHYAPNNAVLVVAGDVAADEVIALAETHYGPLPFEEQPERFRSAEPPQTAARRVVFEDPRVSQRQISRSYLAPERDSGAQEQAAALVYLAELLGGSSFTSALGVALEIENQIAVGTGAWYTAQRLDATTLNLAVAPVDGVSMEEAEAAMDAAIAGFLETGPDEAQVARIRNQIRASEIYAMDNLEGLARRYGSALTQGLTIADVEAWPEVLSAVTAEDIMAVARDVLRPERSVTGWIVAPDEEGDAS